MPNLRPCLTRAEYWILESVAESSYPTYCLGSVKVSAIDNKPGHGLDRQELVDTFERLMSMGWIGVADRRKNQSFEEPFHGTIDRAGIEAALDESMDEQFTRYGLTPEGGRVWESFAQPNWDAYLECYSRGPVGKNQVGVITSATLWRVQKILQNVRLLGHFPNPERTRLRVLRPWKATYWKTLPVGHRAIYLFPEIPHFDRVGVGWDDMPSGFMEVYENCRWYRWK